jgi:hypothetical protein
MRLPTCLRFVARLLDGEAMTDVCRDFGVSRKTGYKMFDRYKEHGLAALSARRRAIAGPISALSCSSFSSNTPARRSWTNIPLSQRIHVPPPRLAYHDDVAIPPRPRKSAARGGFLGIARGPPHAQT